MKKSIEEKVRTVICDQLGVSADEATDDKDIIIDLGADSLDGVELTMAFEEEFEIEITDDEMENTKTVGQAIALVKNKLK